MLELTHLHDSGVFLRREALEHGYDDRDLLAARRDGALVRIRQGTYASRLAWNQADEVQRHLMRADGVLLTHGPDVALSHTTAAAAHGLRLFDPDLRRVHVTRLGNGDGGHTQDISYHVGSVDEGELVRDGERLLLAPTRAALETSSLHTVEQGLVVLDSLIDLGMDDLDGMFSAYRSLRHWPSTGKLQVTTRLVRVGAESVGESRQRFLFWSQHLPEPVLQYEVKDASGQLLGTTDFAWPAHRVLGEFDGRVKYGRYLRPGEAPGDAVFREKRREDRIREATGWTMMRFIWSDLAQPRATAERVRSQLFRAA